LGVLKWTEEYVSKISRKFLCPVPRSKRKEIKENVTNTNTEDGKGNVTNSGNLQTVTLIFSYDILAFSCK
jgi:hypothetical protein